MGVGYNRVGLAMCWEPRLAKDIVTYYYSIPYAMDFLRFSWTAWPRLFNEP